MTQYDYYSQLLHSLILTLSLVGGTLALILTTYVVSILFPYVGPRK